MQEEALEEVISSRILSQRSHPASDRKGNGIGLQTCHVWGIHRICVQTLLRPLSPSNRPTSGSLAAWLDCSHVYQGILWL